MIFIKKRKAALRHREQLLAVSAGVDANPLKFMLLPVIVQG